MTRDEKMYPEPTKFKPERWLPGGIKGVVDPARPEDIAFGYGRRSVKVVHSYLSVAHILLFFRVCPGRSWAEHIVSFFQWHKDRIPIFTNSQQLFIAASSLLASFNIEKAIGPDGILISPNDDYEPDFIRCACTSSPRGRPMLTILRSVGPSKCKITPRSEKIASLIRQTIVD